MAPFISRQFREPFAGKWPETTLPAPAQAEQARGEPSDREGLGAGGGTAFRFRAQILLQRHSRYLESEVNLSSLAAPVRLKYL